MRSLLAPTLALCLASPASAALSGYYDSAKILHAILGDATVADALKQQPIMKIEQTDKGYAISSCDCRVQIEVKRMIAARPGPTPFTLNVGKGLCS